MTDQTDTEHAGVPGRETGEQYAVPAPALDEFAKRYGLLQLENFQLQVQVGEGLKREAALSADAFKAGTEQRAAYRALEDQLAAMTRERDTLYERVRQLDPPQEGGLTRPLGRHTPPDETPQPEVGT